MSPCSDSVVVVFCLIVICAKKEVSHQSHLVDRTSGQTFPFITPYLDTVDLFGDLMNVHCCDGTVDSVQK